MERSSFTRKFIGNGEISVAKPATASVTETLVASNFDVEGKHESSGFFDLDF